jgi:hypothetical protein
MKTQFIRSRDVAQCVDDQKDYDSRPGETAVEFYVRRRIESERQIAAWRAQRAKATAPIQHG